MLSFKAKLHLLHLLHLLQVCLQAAADHLIAGTGADPALVPLAAAYMRIRALAQPAVLLTMVLQSGLLAEQVSWALQYESNWSCMLCSQWSWRVVSRAALVMCINQECLLPSLPIVFCAWCQATCLYGNPQAGTIAFFRQAIAKPTLV